MTNFQKNLLGLAVIIGVGSYAGSAILNGIIATHEMTALVYNSQVNVKAPRQMDIDQSTEPVAEPLREIGKTMQAIEVPTHVLVTRGAGDMPKLEISWTDTEGESGYEIWRTSSIDEARPGEKGTGKKMATVGKDATSYSDLNVRTDRAYQYRVCAITETGERACSQNVVGKVRY